MSSEQIALLLVILAVVLGFCGLMGTLAARLGQPPVIGELLGGVLLGPTLLGSWSEVIVPVTVRPTFTALGNIGVALFMFALAMEFGRGSERNGIRRAGAIATGAMALPFVLGLGTAWLLLGTGLSTPPDITGFVLFMGVAMSITAFPVLARILVDRGIIDTGVGRLALAVAAVCDALAWCALAIVVTIVGGTGSAPWRVALIVPMVLALRFVFRPAMRMAMARAADSRAAGTALTVAMVSGALAHAAATELMGLHFIFGAFLFGLAVPRRDVDSRREDVHAKVMEVSKFFLPVYFVTAGLAVDLGLDGKSLALLGIVVFAAVVGKVAGTYGAARACRIGARPASALAVLMNTRGLTEVVVLTTGLQLGVIGGDLYSAMVVMALITTVATAPALRWLRGRGGTVDDLYSLDLPAAHRPVRA
ncbi:cation:proton antiporter [Amycolatopsis sp. cmx-11-12]|uniref:cation:proton antiporter n=1 Tax=Amycolatopsis sp. cmx-11-12 TaxID=2785795 RepID=UPI003916F730